MPKLSKLGWYWHRLRAMNSKEISHRIEKKLYQRRDRSGLPDFGALALASDSRFPQLPAKSAAPGELLHALRTDVQNILAGRWNAFGHLPIQVDAPPKWQFDYLAGHDAQTEQIAFNLSNRAQPGRADIKLIWEPSRWYQLVRLAMAAWLLDDETARTKTIEWLHSWVQANKPLTGMNWTSGLETGIRLIQYTWIDAFLEQAGTPIKELSELRQQILPPHAWYTWRYRSFGSSANNHLIGELAGLIVALARFSDLVSLSAPLAQIGKDLETEVLLQFAPDGGNQEQALGYHLFSWEFCWQSLRALEASSIPVSSEVKQRLIRAAEFYRDLKPPNDPWEFGDCDNAYVTPLFTNESTAAQEWWNWYDESKTPGLNFWWGKFPKSNEDSRAGEWSIFPDSGYAIFKYEDWFLRWDCSPLGYLSIAPHGHLDALHLSVWYRGQPVIIDPGTGCYYADQNLRTYLADWSAHNGPHILNPPVDFPKRYGVFLWGGHHSIPVLAKVSDLVAQAEISLPYGKSTRRISFVQDRNAFVIEDSFSSRDPQATVVTRWKFDPLVSVKQDSSNLFSASRGESAIQLETDGWSHAKTWNPPVELRGKTVSTVQELGNFPQAALVSNAFRRVGVAPYLHLEAPAESRSFRLTLSAK